jgi:hypothetical protein
MLFNAFANRVGLRDMQGRFATMTAHKEQRQFKSCFARYTECKACIAQLGGYISLANNAHFSAIIVA